MSSPKQAGGGNEPADNAPLLLVENVRAAYVKKEILRGVSLTVNRGEVVALLGGNGSGKSTLLRTIAGILNPTGGAIEYAGRSLHSLSIQARQRLGIGYVLQGGRVFPNLTVAENLTIAASHHRNGRGSKQVEIGSVFSALRRLGSQRAGLLSGGQRQMLAIEAVLAQEPALLLLDEPTGALSPGLAGELLATIADYISRHRCGALLVEQNVVEAMKVCARALRLEEGKVNECAKEHLVAKSPATAALV